MSVNLPELDQFSPQIREHKPNQLRRQYQMNNKERVVYPIHNDDLERLGLPKADEQIGGDGLVFTPYEITEARKRFEKTKHENPLKHRDLSQAIALMIMANEQWDKNYQQLDGDYVKLKEESDTNYRLYQDGIETEKSLERAVQDKNREIDQYLKKVRQLKDTLAVKETALNAKDTKLQEHSSELTEKQVMVGYYEKRYGVFEPGYYESGTVRDLTRWQRSIGRALGILLPPPEKRIK